MSVNESTSPLLYVYGESRLVAALKRARIPLQHDWSFLEPFLSLHRWHVGPSDVVSESEMQAGYRKEYEKLPENVRLWLGFEDFLTQKDKFEAQVKASVLANRSRKVPKYPISRFEKTACLRLFDSAVCSFGWTDLSAQYSGICVAIRKQAECLQSSPGAPALLLPVQYDAAHQFQPDSGNPLPGAFLDVPDHQTRGEWRLITPKKDDENSLKFKRQDIQRIYVSVLTPDAVVNDLIQLVQRDLNFRHVELFSVLPDAGYWRLTAQRINVD